MVPNRANFDDEFMLKPKNLLRVLLLVAGAIGIAVGGALLFVPVAFEASAGIMVGDDPSLLSELRAPGGALLASGVLVGMGAFVRTLTFTSMLLSAMLYLGYGVARLVSLAVDGRPATSLLMAMLLELVIGGMCLFALLATRKARSGVSSGMVDSVNLTS